MSKKPRIVGTLRFESPVEVSPGWFVAKSSAAGHVRHHLTILDHALGAFGQFRVDRYLLPGTGAFSVDVLDTSAAGDAIFDHDDFHSLLIQLNRTCNEVIGSDLDSTGLAAVAADVAARTGCAQGRIHRFLETVQRHDGVTVIDNEGHGILLGSQHRPTPELQAAIDVDVADLKKLIRIDTADNTYVVDASAHTDLKHGDKIKISAGPLGEMQCIAVDAATPIPDPLPPSLFD